MSILEIIKSYYDEKKIYTNERINVDKEYDYAFEGNIVELYSGDKKVLTAEYEIVGSYNHQMSIWYWSYAVSFVNKTLVNNSKNVKEFSRYIKENHKNFEAEEAEKYYYYAKNPTFFIIEDEIINILMLALYVNKYIWIFPVKKLVNNMTEYIIIKKIVQL